MAGSEPEVAGAPDDPGVRAVVFQILDQVLHHGGNSSRLLEGARVASTTDRALATELTLGLLRRLGSLDAYLEQLSARPLGSLDPPVLLALRIGIYQLVYLDRVPDHAAVDSTVRVARRAAGRAGAAFVNGVLRSYTRRRSELRLPGPEEPTAYLEKTLSLPTFLAARWTARFGHAATVAVAAAAGRPPAVHLRVVRGRATPAEVLARLKKAGIEARRGRFVGHAIEIVKGPIVTSRILTDGFAIVQDEAAQLVGELLQLRPGQRLLDVCAAPGGKAIGAADRIRGGGYVIACDLHTGRLRRVRANVRATQAVGIALVAADGKSPPFLEASFDQVLVDAPCTSTGTIRRNPEVRYRVTADNIARSAARASAILAAAAPLIRPGGRLVYSTCSLEPEENEGVIAEFLARHGGSFRVIDPRPLLPPAAHHMVDDDLLLRTQPREPDLDGLTAAVLERSGE